MTWHIGRRAVRRVSFRPMFDLRPEAATDVAAVERLLDRSFGVRRHHKVSYRYRHGIEPVAELCLVAEGGDGLVGAIRYWPIRLGARPALLLGPLAIAPERRGHGIGRALVRETLDIAARSGPALVFLVGDPAYYGRFGFVPAPPAIVMPGETPGRLQYQGLADAPLPAKGALRRRQAAPIPATPPSPTRRPTSRIATSTSFS